MEMVDKDNVTLIKKASDDSKAANDFTDISENQFNKLKEELINRRKTVQNLTSIVDENTKLIESIEKNVIELQRANLAVTERSLVKNVCYYFVGTNESKFQDYMKSITTQSKPFDWIECLDSLEIDKDKRLFIEERRREFKASNHQLKTKEEYLSYIDRFVSDENKRSQYQQFVCDIFGDNVESNLIGAFACEAGKELLEKELKKKSSNKQHQQLQFNNNISRGEMKNIDRGRDHQRAHERSRFRSRSNGNHYRETERRRTRSRSNRNHYRETERRRTRYRSNRNR